MTDSIASNTGNLRNDPVDSVDSTDNIVADNMCFGAVVKMMGERFDSRMVRGIVPAFNNLGLSILPVKSVFGYTECTLLFRRSFVKGGFQRFNSL